MSSTVVPLLSFALALGMALYVCPIIIRAAKKYGIVDKPNSDLKVHREPVPYLGGLVVFAALLTALAVALTFDGTVLAILLCASLVVSVGLVDDLGTLTPKDKLLGQLVAALVLVKAGVVIDIQSWPTPLPQALTMLWIVTCMNAFNILDVSDGLAASTAMVAGIGMGTVAWLNREPMILVFAASIVGATAGFWWFNKEPARIYLGDTGSLLLGALLGALAVVGRYSTTNSVSPFFVPLCLMAVPLFDLVLVIVARMAARRPIYHGSPDHFAVRLRDHGFPPSRISLLSAFVAVGFSAAGISSTLLGDASALAIAGGTVLFGALLLFAILWRFPSRLSPRFERPATPGAPLEQRPSSTP